METFAAGLAFAVFLLAQVTAVVAVRAANNGGHSQAYDAIRRDRGARAIWDSAN